MQTKFRFVLVALVGAVILVGIQLVDGLTVEHFRILTLGVVYGMLLLGVSRGAVIPLALGVLHSVQRWRSNVT